MNTKTAVFSVRLKSSTLAAVKALAEAEERSVNGVISRILDRAVQPEEEGK